MKTPPQWPLLQGTLLPGNAAHPAPTQDPCWGHVSHRPSLAILMHRTWQSRGRARSKVAGSTQLWPGPALGLFPPAHPHPLPPPPSLCGACRALGISADTELGGVLQSPEPTLKIPGLGTQLVVLHSRKKKKAQTVLKRCLGHQPRERVLMGKAEGCPPEQLVCRPGVVAQWTEAMRSSVGLQRNRHRHGDRPQSQGALTRPLGPSANLEQAGPGGGTGQRAEQ